MMEDVMRSLRIMVEEYEKKFKTKPPTVNRPPEYSIVLIKKAIKTGVPMSQGIPKGADS